VPTPSNPSTKTAAAPTTSTTTSPGVNSTYFVALEGVSEAFHKPFAGVDANASMLYGHHPDSVPLN
jgi:hypothetical protein